MLREATANNMLHESIVWLEGISPSLFHISFVVPVFLFFFVLQLFPGSTKQKQKKIHAHLY